MATATSDDGVKTGVKTGVLFFDKLPREIRDEVYRLSSVGDGNPFKLRMMTNIMSDIREARKQGGRVVSLPVNPLRQFAVSRKFYREGVAGWFRLRTIQEYDEHTYSPFVGESIPARIRTQIIRLGIDLKVGTSARDRECSNLCDLEHFTSLHTLTVQLRSEIFDVFVDRLCCDAAFGPQDFASILEVQDIIKLPAIKVVVFMPVICMIARTAQETAQWERNVKELEVYVQAQIDKRRQEAGAKKLHLENAKLQQDSGSAETEKIVPKRRAAASRSRSGRQTQRGVMAEPVFGVAPRDLVLGLLLVNLVLRCCRSLSSHRRAS